MNSDPSATEIVDWAYRKDPFPLFEDWDLILGCGAERLELAIQLASDRNCPHKNIFLSVLGQRIVEYIRDGQTKEFRAFLERLSLQKDNDIDGLIAQYSQRPPAIYFYMQKRLITTILLSFITIGIYVPVWFLLQKKNLDHMSAKYSVKITLPVIALVALTVQILFIMSWGFF